MRCRWSAHSLVGDDLFRSVGESLPFRNSKAEHPTPFVGEVVAPAALRACSILPLAEHEPFLFKTSQRGIDRASCKSEIAAAASFNLFGDAITVTRQFADNEKHERLHNSAQELIQILAHACIGHTGIILSR